MRRRATLALAALAGAAALAAAQLPQPGAGGLHRTADPGAGPAADAVPGPGVAAPSAAGEGLRLCIGPARVTLGARVKLALGGEGCKASAAGVVGFGALREEAARVMPAEWPSLF